jgi:hypothetical protein
MLILGGNGVDCVCKYVAYVELDTAGHYDRVPDREGFWFYFSACETDGPNLDDGGAWYCAMSGYLVRPAVASDRLYLMFRAWQRRPFRRVARGELVSFLHAAVIEFEDGRSKLWQRCGWKLDISAQALFERLDQPDLLAALWNWQNARSLVLHIERRLKSTDDIGPGSDIDTLELDTITTLVRQRLGLLARRVHRAT